MTSSPMTASKQTDLEEAKNTYTYKSDIIKNTRSFQMR